MRKKHLIRKHLRAWREKFDQSQVWLANEIGTSHTSIRRQELGESGVDDETFAAIAKAYGITVAELSAPPGEAERAQQMDRVMRAIQHLDQESLSVVAGLAERLKAPK